MEVFVCVLLIYITYTVGERGGLKSLGLYLWYKCTKMHHFHTKTPQITVCCKTSYDIVFILLSAQNLVS